MRWVALRGQIATEFDAPAALESARQVAIDRWGPEVRVESFADYHERRHREAIEADSLRLRAEHSHAA